MYTEKTTKALQFLYLLIAICVTCTVLVNCAPETAVPTATPTPATKIIFESNRTGFNDLYSVLPNGTNLTNLTNTDSAHEYSPNWSPDGREVAYISDPRSSTNDTYGWDMKLMIMDHDGNNPRILDQDAPMYRPLWSPSGDRIVYQKGAPERALYAVNRNQDGTWEAAQQICPSGVELNNIYTRYTFYGSDHILFDGMNPLSIYRMNLGTCEIEEFESTYNDIQYAPDVATNEKIVFVRNQNYVQSLYVKSGFGTGSVTILNNTDPFPHMPLWSNNGEYVFYWSNSSGTGPGPIEIYNLTTNGLTTMNSTISVSGSESATYLEHQYLQRWSPDDDKVVFVGTHEGATNSVGDEVYVLDVGNDSIINISNDADAIDTSPAWQPAAQSISDGPDLVVVDAGVRTSSDGQTIEVFFKIRNIGSVTSTASLVYVNAINPNITEPGSENKIRQQQSFTITGLTPNEETIELISTISLLNYQQESIQYFDVLADAKDQVLETNEANNNLQILGLP